VCQAYLRTAVYREHEMLSGQLIPVCILRSYRASITMRWNLIKNHDLRKSRNKVVGENFSWVWGAWPLAPPWIRYFCVLHCRFDIFIFRHTAVAPMETDPAALKPPSSPYPQTHPGVGLYRPRYLLPLNATPDDATASSVKQVLLASTALSTLARWRHQSLVAFSTQ